MEPLPTNQYLRAVEFKARINKASRNISGPRFGDHQPEHLCLEELTAQLIKEITGANAWELSEDEFTELASSQDRYACFVSITALWHRLIIEGINSGEAKDINKEALDTLAWRGIREINAAYYSKFGVYLWEPGTGMSETKDVNDDSEDDPTGLKPAGHDVEGQLLLFQENQNERNREID